MFHCVFCLVRMAAIVPPLPSVPGLASFAFRRLDDALMDPALRAKLSAPKAISG